MKFTEVKMRGLIEIVSFAVLLFWFITVPVWNPLKYALAALLVLLIIDFAKDQKFFWEENGRRKRGRRR